MGEDQVQFFFSTDFLDVRSPFVLRKRSSTGLRLLQSHGWLDGFLPSGTLSEAAAKYNPSDSSTWPVVVPRHGVDFVDRYGAELAAKPMHVPLERLRRPSLQKPRLSVVIIRWGGDKRIDEDTTDEDLFRQGGWGLFGSPPCDWYISGMVNSCTGLHSEKSFLSDCLIGLDGEFLSIFLGSTEDVHNLTEEAPALSSELAGVKRTSFWMLWPADWEADWKDEHYAGFIERRSLFAAMRSFECAGTPASFPHPASLYEFITSKTWMATFSPKPEIRLPAAVLVKKEDIVADAHLASTRALNDLNVIRKTTCFAASGGPSVFNRQGVQKGVVKIGWSWEAKYVWPWTGLAELASCLSGMMSLPGCLAEFCIVQEWVDFDFELRLFYFPPRNWSPSVPLRALHHAYTAWDNDSLDFGRRTFRILSTAECVHAWMGDEAALALAYSQAEETAQFLIARLMDVHPEPVPFMRLDFMLRRLGPGTVQVAFGEYCETGACCIQWNGGPPMVWRAVVDHALHTGEGSC